MCSIGFTQTTDFLPYVGHFFTPEGEKNDLHKKGSTLSREAEVYGVAASAAD